MKRRFGYSAFRTCKTSDMSTRSSLEVRPLPLYAPVPGDANEEYLTCQSRAALSGASVNNWSGRLTKSAKDFWHNPSTTSPRENVRLPNFCTGPLEKNRHRCQYLVRIWRCTSGL